MKYLTQAILTASLMVASSAQAAVIDFSTDTTLGGGAYISGIPTPNEVVLTNNNNGQVGTAFTTQSYNSINKFTASFDMQIGGGSGADGLTFAWVQNPNISLLTGGGLGFTGMTGYAIEFDTFRNGWDSGSENHVAVIQDASTNKLLQTEITSFNLNDSVYRNVQVEFDSGVLSVDIDGTNYINNFSIGGYSAFDGYFGFTAGTGARNDWHKISNFNLTVSPVPEPSTYALMLGGLGLVGFMAYRRRKTA